jgi:multidrug efflux system membrane fusion protein
VPVTVATVVQKAAPVLLRTIGNVDAYSTVSVKAQVSAELMEVRFREGQFVRKGDLLFLLDRRPFDAALHQAEATLAHDRAQAANARVEAQRYEKLWQGGVSPKEQFDQYRTAADALDAAVKADDAAVEMAKLNLEYCSIYSPIDGQTSNLMVYPGNLVKANDVPILVTINQIQPIYVEFTIAEASLADVRAAMRGRPLTVEVRTQDNPTQPERGVLNFINNQVDTTTGTIHLKATFSNQARRLWPGQFVDVMLRLAEQPNAIVIPAQAVQSGQDGAYVFVVRKDGTVESRAVVVARSLDGESVIDKGLASGERVVTDGQLRLVPGAKVAVRSGS